MKIKVILLCVFLVLGCGKTSESPPSTPQPPQSPAPATEIEPKRNERVELNFQKFGIIREFGADDNAALFGVRSEVGAFTVTKVVSPGFIKTFQVGKLTQSSLDKLFLKSSKPLNQAEKMDLLSKFNESTVLYAEGYDGNLCTEDEIKFEVIATGSVNEVNVEVTFQFDAKPNPNGNCKFQIFGILVTYIN